MKSFTQHVGRYPGHLGVRRRQEADAGAQGAVGTERLPSDITGQTEQPIRVFDSLILDVSRPLSLEGIVDSALACEQWHQVHRPLSANIGETTASSFITVEGKEAGCHGGYREFEKG
jgi:hypothetical protein